MPTQTDTPSLASPHIARSDEAAPARFRVVPQNNPSLRVDELFLRYEDLRSPRFLELRNRFKLDDVVRGVQGEFDRILALRHWMSRFIRIENDNPTPLEHDDAWDILLAAEAGGGFHCAHFRLVQQAVLSAFGYVTRSMGAGNGQLDRGRYHGVNEVWVNELGKWVLSDAKYDVHYEKAGEPLSALEMRAEILADGAAAVERAYGPSRRPQPAPNPDTLDTYRWVAWELNGNAFSNYPNCPSSALILFEDEYTKANTWYRDGKPNWAYDARYFITTPHQNWIQWTPNVIASHVTIIGDRVSIKLRSCTPNFRGYAMRQAGDEWRACSDRIDLALPADALRLEFRSENAAGVTGPVHRVVIEPV